MTIRGILEVGRRNAVFLALLLILWSSHAYAAPLDPGDRGLLRRQIVTAAVIVRPVAVPAQMYEHDCVVAVVALRYGLSVGYVHAKINAWYGEPYPFDEMGIDYPMVDAALPGYNLNESRPATDANLASAPYNAILSYAGHAWNLRFFDRVRRTVIVRDPYTGNTAVLNIESDNGWGVPWRVERKVSLPTEAVARYVTHYNARLVGK